MGIGSSIKKAFKKIGKAVKKVVKKTVKGIKKVVKKIGSSKILKALAIAAAVVVTGGAALTAFGGTGALATSKLGSFMMSASSKVLGGTLFGTGATTTLGKIAQGAGNFLTQTVAKPFGAVGGALGSGARVVANISQGLPAFQSGPAGAFEAVSAPTPFSREALTGQMQVADTVSYDDVTKKWINTDATGNVRALTKSELSNLPDAYSLNPEKYVKPLDIDKMLETMNPDVVEQVVKDTQHLYPTEAEYAKTATKGFAERYPIATNIATGVGTSVLTGAINQRLAGDPEYSVSPDGLLVESASNFDPLRIYAAERGIAVDDMYRHFTFGNTLETGMTPLFKQETIGVV